MEAANDAGVTLNAGCNGDLTSKQAGSLGQTVRELIANIYKKSNLNSGKNRRNAWVKVNKDVK